MKELRKTKRSKLSRKPKKANYDRREAYAILDEALVAHIGIIDKGVPVVIPRNHWRIGDTLYFHGSTASRTTREMVRPGADCCVEVSIVDGLAFAHSTWHISVNYRSFIGFGQAFLVDDPDRKMKLLEALVERIAPGRWAQGAKPPANELKATAVIGFPLDEASIKVRQGPPDELADEDLSIWSGVMPLDETAGPLQPAPGQDPEIPVPDYLVDWKQPF